MLFSAICEPMTLSIDLRPISEAILKIIDEVIQESEQALEEVVDSFGRSFFSIAHELGHLLLHGCYALWHWLYHAYYSVVYRIHEAVQDRRTKAHAEILVQRVQISALESAMLQHAHTEKWIYLLRTQNRGAEESSDSDLIGGVYVITNH